MTALKSKRFSPYQKTAAKLAAVLAREYGSAYWVGGTIRDMLLGRSMDDIDMATSATPAQVKKTLLAMKLKPFTIGEKYGTIGAAIGNHKIEITTYRSEREYADHRHPGKVKFLLSPEADAMRRDFTVNALYWNPNSGELLDPVGGLKDLAAKRLRFIGKAKDRIVEDPLRMLRAARLSAALGFSIVAADARAIRKHARLITALPGERMKSELDKMIMSGNSAEAIKLLDTLGLLDAILPELTRLKSVKQSRNYHAEGNVFVHTMKVFGLAAKNSARGAAASSGDERVFRYAVLFHDLGKFGTAMPTTRDGRKHISFPQHGPSGAAIFLNIAERLHFSAAERQSIAYLIDHHMDLRRPELFTDRSLARAMGHPLFDQLIRLRAADNSGAIRTNRDGTVLPANVAPISALARRVAILRKRGAKPLLTAKEIMKATGIPQSPAIGKIIRSLAERQAIGEIKTRAQAIAAVKAMAQGGT